MQNKISYEVKQKIIKLYLDGNDVNEIYFRDDISCQKVTIIQIIKEYCKSIGQESPKLFKSHKTRLTTKQQIKEELKKQLKQGRPKQIVEKIAEKYDIQLEDENDYER